MSGTRDARVALDASAVLAWVLKERGYETIDKVLPVAVLPASAMVEVLYRARERGHHMPSPELHDSLLAMGVRVEPVIAADVVRAAELISTSRTNAIPEDGRTLSLGDGLCIAVAERLDLTLAGGDQYWESCDLRVQFMPFR